MRTWQMAAVAMWLGATLSADRRPAAAQAVADDLKVCADFKAAGQIAACTNVLQSGHATSAERVQALTSRSLAYAAKKDFAHAIADCTARLQLDPSAAARIARGRIYQASGDLPASLRDFDEAIRLEPGDANTWFNRGFAHKVMGRYDEAIHDYTQAIGLQASERLHALSILYRGSAYWGKGDDDAAMRDFNDSIALYSTLGFSYERRGGLELCLGRFAAAQADFEAALKLNPAVTPAGARLALWLYVARARAGIDGRADLQKDLAHFNLDQWPGPLASFFLGKGTSTSVLAAAADPDPAQERSQRADAYYFLAQKALIDRTNLNARRFFELAEKVAEPNANTFDATRDELRQYPRPVIEIAAAKAEPAPSRPEPPPADRGMTRPTTVAAPPASTGGYFALVIGIDNYPPPLHKLSTAVRDAQAVANDLRDLYGFQVTLLTNADATRAKIITAIRAYRNTLKPDDSLVIYYAGHGTSEKDADKAYWLPIDADSSDSPNAIIADDVTTGVRLLAARHVLIISDSCYAAGMSRSEDPVPPPVEQRTFLNKMLLAKSRTLMASGGDEPVSDRGTDGHSIFAYAVLQALEHADGAMFTASDLFYKKVLQQVAGKSDQTPQYQFIKNSGHDSGDFVFVRKAKP